MKTKQAINYVAARLLTDDEFVLFALQVLYNEQTEYEQEIRKTLDPNERGFNIVDARKFTNMAERALKRGYLEPEELSKCRQLDKRGLPVLAKYALQITRVCEAAELPLPIPRKPPTKEGSSAESGEELA